jgi:WD40 repeat protein
MSLHYVCVATCSYPDAVLLRTVSFIDTPESIVFTMNEEGDDELIIGLRDTAYLVYLPCATFIETRVSLNVNDWDTHCSFTPLHLALSPDKSLLLVASDKHMHFVYQVRTNKRLATLAGHSCSDYGKPRVAWHPSGKYVYSNSEHDNRLHIYSLASQRIVHSLAGHSGLIKDLAANSSSGVVATASYDKTLILWR